MGEGAAMTPAPPPHPVDEIYERFKHLDKLLSDEKSCEQAAKECSSPIYLIAGDLWRAIKAEREYASHSSATNAEQAIDAFEKLLIESEMDMVYFMAGKGVVSYMRELRQQAGEEFV